jgi:hypothetical protein
MNDDTNQVLTQAHDLIEAEQLEDARRLLEPLLDREKDNADVWWLYAHAVSDAETARKALQNVLRIDPNYPEANELLKTLEATYPAAAPSPLRPIARLDVHTPPAALPDLPPTLPEKVDEWEFEEAGEGKAESRRVLTPRQLALLISILVVVIVGGLLAILNSARLPSATATPTAESQSAIPTLPVVELTPTLLETAVVGGTVTEEGTARSTQAVATTSPPDTDTPIRTAEPQLSTSTPGTTAESYEAIFDALSDFTLPREAIEVTDTSLGETLLVSVCTIAGPELRAALPQAMNAIARASASLMPDVDAVGVRMLNCGNNTTLLVIGAPLEAALSYAGGELNDEAFQAQWRSQ